MIQLCYLIFLVVIEWYFLYIQLQMGTLQSRLDAEFLLAHMCSVKFKEWIVVLATLLRRSEVRFAFSILTLRTNSPVHGSENLNAECMPKMPDSKQNNFWRIDLLSSVCTLLLCNHQVLFDLFRHDLRLWKAYSATLQVRHTLNFVLLVNMPLSLSLLFWGNFNLLFAA